MAKRQTTFLLKRSNVPGKIPPISGLTSGELALNTADAILYTSGSTSGTILPIGWDRVARTGDTMTGTLFTPYLSATTISATTYFNLPTDIRVTGGTYTNGTATFVNNTGGTFTVTGFSTGGTSSTDTFVTGATYSNNTFTYRNNTGGTFNVLFNTMTGLTVNGNVVVTGTTTVGSSNDGLTKLYVETNTLNTAIKGYGTSVGVLGSTTGIGYGVVGQGNGGYGVYGTTTSNTGGTSGVYGWSVGDTYTNIGVYGLASDDEVDTATNIGGFFYAAGQGLYNYSVKLNDGTEGLNKVLISKTADGKANWSSILSGLTGVYTNTLSATTYFNLPTDIRVTGGTFNDTTGVATFTNNTGGTFNVNGFSIGGGGSVFTGGTVTGPTVFTNGLTANTISATTYYNLPESTDTFVTGATYSNNTFTYRNNTGGTFNVLFNTMTGLTSSGTISTSVLSATTYQNLPTDVRVTGGTYSSGTATFTNNTGGTFTVTGFSAGGGSTFTGGTVSGATYFTGGVSANTLTSSGTGQNILTVIGSGNSTTSPIFSVVGSQGELFSVSDSLTGSLFSVNDISGLPILEVFSDNTTLMGSYQAPSLNTTKKVSLTAGTNTVYSIPTSGYTGAFIDYTVISTGSTGARAGTIMSIWSGTTAQSTDVSTNDIGTTAGITFSVAVVGSNAVLSSSATTTGWTLKTIIRSI